VLTNHFGQFREFNYTNVNHPATPGEYFRFVVP
jgi:hypothetical protein